MIIGILTAMDNERALISELLENRHEIKAEYIQYTSGSCGRHHIVLASSGIGKVNAALGAEAMLRLFRPEALLSTGVAGGIDQSLHVMDVVAGSEYSYHDVWCGKPNAIGQVQGMPAVFKGDKNMLSAASMLAMLRAAAGKENGDAVNGKNKARIENAAKPLINEEPRIHCGLIVSGDQFIENKERLEVIKKDFPAALAADMESAALAQTCFIKKVPFMSFRIISDVAGSENQLASYTDFWGEMAARSFSVTKAFIAAIP